MTRPGPKNLDATAAPSDERSQQASARSNCYGLLALVFRDAPTQEMVAQFRSGSLAEVLGECGYDVAEDLAGELAAVTEALSEDYTSVFVGPGHHVSPYASVHREGEGQLWGESTARVKRLIEAIGLSFEGNWDSIPDHIAVQFELMQRLTAHEACLWTQRVSTGPERLKVDEQLRRCLEVEEIFLREHLSTWIPRFCAKVLDTLAGRFYPEMAKLAESVVISDVERMTTVKDSLLSD